VTWISGEFRLGLQASLHSCSVTRVSTFRSVKGILYWFFFRRSSFSAKAEGDILERVFRSRWMPPETERWIGGGPNGWSTFQGSSEGSDCVPFLGDLAMVKRGDLE
jgi:hypothetical protein